MGIYFYYDLSQPQSFGYLMRKQDWLRPVSRLLLGVFLILLCETKVDAMAILS